MGWFFGFKLHLVFNNDNEIVALKLTPGNDTTPVPALTRDLTGKLFGDKGYIGRKLAEDLLRRGLTLFTRVRKNMKTPAPGGSGSAGGAPCGRDASLDRTMGRCGGSTHRKVPQALIRECEGGPCHQDRSRRASLQHLVRMVSSSEST